MCYWTYPYSPLTIRHLQILIADNGIDANCENCPKSIGQWDMLTTEMNHPQCLQVSYGQTTCVCVRVCGLWYLYTYNSAGQIIKGRILILVRTLYYSLPGQNGHISLLKWYDWVTTVLRLTTVFINFAKLVTSSLRIMISFNYLGPPLFSLSLHLKMSSSTGESKKLTERAFILSSRSRTYIYVNYISR